MRLLLSLALLAGLLGGCAGSIPFRQAAPVDMRDADPRAVVERFKEKIPPDYHLLSSIVFEYNWFSISGIGYVDINTVDGSYKVVCMNHLGVKLFEFEGDRNGLTSRYVMEPLARQGNVAAAVAGDIKRVYLDLVPSARSHVARRKQKLIFRQRSGEGALEYEFAGEGRNLLSKTYREDERAVWRVSYYDYLARNGKLYPMGVIVANYRHGYRLIVRQKEIQD